MAAGEWHEVAGGWMQEPGPDGRYPEDVKPVVVLADDGSPLAMALLDVDAFGVIDPAMVPDELDGMYVCYWDEPPATH